MQSQFPYNSLLIKTDPAKVADKELQNTENKFDFSKINKIPGIFKRSKEEEHAMREKQYKKNVETMRSASQHEQVDDPEQLIE